MRFWIVKYGEAVPFAPEREGGQLFRAGSIARALSTRGHDVTWWTGRFEHQTKDFVAPAGTETIADPESELTVRLIDSPGYRKNVSLSRLIDHAVFRRRLRAAMRSSPKPDLILTSFPIPEIAIDCVRFGKTMNIPVVVDVRDLWPDVVVGRLKDKIGFFPKSLTQLYRRKVSKLFHRCDAIYATSEGYLEWAQKLGQREIGVRGWDNFFFLSSDPPSPSPRFRETQKESWEQKGVDFSRTVFCWAGSLSAQKTHINLLDAFDQLPQAVADRVQLVVCGRGDLEGRAKAMAERHSHVVFAGFVPNADVKGLCLNADIGLFCYDDVESFRLNYTNKFGEYMGCGLPVLTTVTGAMVEGFAADAVIPTGGSEAADIARAVTQLANVPPGENVKAAARNIHRDHFNAPKTYSNICEGLENIVDEFQALNGD